MPWRQVRYDMWLWIMDPQKGLEIEVSPKDLYEVEEYNAHRPHKLTLPHTYKTGP